MFGEPGDAPFATTILCPVGDRLLDNVQDDRDPSLDHRNRLPPETVHVIARHLGSPRDEIEVQVPAQFSRAGVDLWSELHEGDWIAVKLPVIGVAGRTRLTRVAQVEASDGIAGMRLRLVSVAPITEKTPKSIIEVEGGSRRPSDDDFTYELKRQDRRVFSLEQVWP